MSENEEEKELEIQFEKKKKKEAKEALEAAEKEMALQPIELTATGKPKRISKGGWKFNTSYEQQVKMLNLFAKGVSFADIARVTGVTPGAVSWTIKTYQGILKEAERAQVYPDLRNDFLRAAELKIIKSVLESDKVDKADLKSLAQSFKEFFNARRLEENKSTQNTNVNVAQFTKVDLDGFKKD